MTGEQAEALYWAESRKHDWHATSGQLQSQRAQRAILWEAMIRAIKDDFREEMERLRDENRALRESCRVAELA